MKDNEQMNPGIRNQAEYMSRNETHFNESSNRNVGIIYTPSSTYRNVETPMWASKNGDEQTAIDIINKDVSYEEIEKPAQTIGDDEVHSHNELENTDRQYPEEGRGLVVDVLAIEKERVIEDNIEQGITTKDNDDRVHTDLRDDGKEVKILDQNTGSDNCTREAADEIQPDDYEYQVKELWHPIRELVSNIETDTDVICIKDELVHTEHEEICPETLGNDDRVYTDLRDDRKEVEISDQYTGSDHSTKEAANEIQPDDHKYLIKDLWPPIKELASNIETGTQRRSIEGELVHTEHEETYPQTPVNNDKVYTDHRDDREEIDTLEQYTDRDRPIHLEPILTDTKSYRF